MSESDAKAVYSFTFLLDGIGDPNVGRLLTRVIQDDLGLVSRCDPAGMTLVVSSSRTFDEDLADRIVQVTRRFGLEARDRVGSSFVASIGADRLRRRLADEWASRFATALVFGLPALCLHYLTPWLTTGPRYVPRAIEAALVGWSIIAAGWPIVHQGAASIMWRRVTPDLVAGLLIVVSFAIGIFQVAIGSPATTLHVTCYALLAVTLQRLLVWRGARRLEGTSHLMLPAAQPLGLILALGTLTAVFDLSGGLAVVLATPVMIGSLAINRLSTPTAAIMPILAFVALLAIAPFLLPYEQIAGRTEAAFGFCVMVSLLYGLSLGQRRGAAHPGAGVE